MPESQAASATWSYVHILLILVVLMALVAYLLIRILVLDEQANQDSLPNLRVNKP
jgi:preprotein translocase subunit YajC